MEMYYSILKTTNKAKNKVWKEIYKTENKEIAIEVATRYYMKHRPIRIVVDQFKPYYDENDGLYDEDFIGTIWDSENIAPWE